MSNKSPNNTRDTPETSVYSSSEHVASPSQVLSTVVAAVVKEPLSVPDATINRIVTLNATDFKRRKRGRFEKVGECVFDSIQDYRAFFVCGQHTDYRSPCVNETTLTNYPLVYEEWQSQESSNESDVGVKSWYRCRRQRRFRRKGGRPVRTKRKMKDKKNYIGCGCRARYSSQIRADGSVHVVFYEKHNHCVQEEYAAEFLNPMKHVGFIRQIVDSKLFAGVKRVGVILQDVITETLAGRDNHTHFSDLRKFKMGCYLKPSQISNRRDQLGLNLDKITHK